MKPQIIYDGKALDSDRPSTFSEDCNRLAQKTAIVSAGVIASPLIVAAAVVYGISEAVHAAKELKK